jgi:hypothetical protein
MLVIQEGPPIAPPIDEAIQANFVARYNKSDSETSCHLDPEVLFAARLHPGGVDRVYHATSGDGARFVFSKGAFYEGDNQLPRSVLKVSPDRSVSFSLKLPKGPHDSSLTFLCQHDKYSFRTVYFPREGEEKSQLFAIEVDDGVPGILGKSITMPYWTEIEGRADVDEILLRRGIKYDREKGLFEARIDDLILRAAATIPAQKILEDYFPTSLRENPFEAGVEEDVWARSDWMKDFGISLSRLVEVPVFSSEMVNGSLPTEK